MMGMWRTAMNAVVSVYLIVMLSGCALRGEVVRCNRRLEPINVPAPRATQVVAPAGNSESNAVRLDRE